MSTLFNGGVRRLWRWDLGLGRIACISFRPRGVTIYPEFGEKPLH